MISASGWVPRGHAAELPMKYELDDEEMARIAGMAGLSLEETEANVGVPEDLSQDDMSEMNQDSEEDETEDTGNLEVHKLGDQLSRDNNLEQYNMESVVLKSDDEGEEVTMLPGLSDARFHEVADGEDPYITLPTAEDQEAEREELQVFPTDNLVLSTRTEDDVSFLDVYVYDDGAGFHDPNIPQMEGDELDRDVAQGLVRDPSLYVHHDLMLPAFPLCVEWINYNVNSAPNNASNFAAIGTFDPSIEIWNLDCVDKAFPDLILGEPIDNSLLGLEAQKAARKKKSMKKNRNKHVPTHHTDAILSLAHNKQFTAVLASTSADHTVKLWDLNNGTAVQSFSSIHAEKNVSASEWYPDNGSILLTAGYDSRVALSDVRIKEESSMSKYWSVQEGEEIESATMADLNVIMCGTDAGNIYAFDIRKQEGSRPLWTLKAHDAGISALSCNKFVPGMFTSGAMGEKSIKLWKYPVGAPEEVQGKGPHMVISRDFDVGNVLTSSFAPDIEISGTMVIGGVNKGLKLWDVFTNRTVRKQFSEELSTVQKTAVNIAKQNGRSSRISRKYMKNDNPDTVIQIDDQGEDEDDEE